MEQVWLSRLRWRVRGAWQWPTFAVLTAVETVLLHTLPLAGDSTSWVGAFLLAAFFNLIALAVAGPLLGLALRRRRPDLPFVVASDRGATVAMGVVLLVVVGVGLAHRPERAADDRALAEQARVVRAYVAAHGAPQYRRRVDEADSLRLGDVYRTCVPGDDPARWLCVFVDMSESPPGVRPDTNPVSNDAFVRTLRP
jgi:hypothetical protein